MCAGTFTNSPWPAAPIAIGALESIAALYAIEAEIRGRTAIERRAVRQEKARPMVEEFNPGCAPSLF